MEQLLNELKILLDKPIGENRLRYRQMYERVFNHRPPGCKCKNLEIYNDLKNWYISTIKTKEDESNRKTSETDT